MQPLNELGKVGEIGRFPRDSPARTLGDFVASVQRTARETPMERPRG